MFTAIRGSRTTAPLRHALPDAAAVAFDALMAAADVTRDRELTNRKRRECSRLPLIISSLEIFTVPQPHVSPHTQGCKRWVQRVSRARGGCKHTDGHLFRTSAIFPRASVAHVGLELSQSYAATAASFATSAARCCSSITTACSVNNTTLYVS